jgi:hypothetical protein
MPFLTEGPMVSPDVRWGCEMSGDHGAPADITNTGAGFGGAVQLNRGDRKKDSEM